jgi:hypothetical protein
LLKLCQHLLSTQLPVFSRHVFKACDGFLLAEATKMIAPPCHTYFILILLALWREQIVHSRWFGRFGHLVRVKVVVDVNLAAVLAMAC